MGMFDWFKSKGADSDVQSASDAGSGKLSWAPIAEERQEWTPELFRSMLGKSQLARGDSIAQMLAGKLVSGDISLLVSKRVVHGGRSCDDDREDWLCSLIGVALIDACVAKCNAVYGMRWIEMVVQFLTSYAWNRLPYFMSLYEDRQRFGREQAAVMASSLHDRMAGLDMRDALFNMSLIMNCTWLAMKLYPNSEESESIGLAEAYTEQARKSAAEFLQGVREYVMREA